MRLCAVGVYSTRRGGGEQEHGQSHESIQSANVLLLSAIAGDMWITDRMWEWTVRVLA